MQIGQFFRGPENNPSVSVTHFLHKKWPFSQVFPPSTSTSRPCPSQIRFGINFLRFLVRARWVMLTGAGIFLGYQRLGPPEVPFHLRIHCLFHLIGNPFVNP